eukprot:TRINITY_DN8255_c0_g1_i1.p1 TRINITY_DN8255_c0_g1~~TRINITY_DN8255_c0_g1_i1.p1  ORF type:complete len:89 (-),score=7.99 TRINITY_DN8255_c0_g1_i1:10-276(-)
MQKFPYVHQLKTFCESRGLVLEAAKLRDVHTYNTQSYEIKSRRAYRQSTNKMESACVLLSKVRSARDGKIQNLSPGFVERLLELKSEK